MSGYGGCDDESLHAMILSENEVERVRQLNQVNSSRPTRQHCMQCDDPIPAARQQAVPGVQHCIMCAPKFEQRPKIRMLDHIL